MNTQGNRSQTVGRLVSGVAALAFVAMTHMAHAEEADRYMQVLAQFLSRVEAQT